MTNPTDSISSNRKPRIGVLALQGDFAAHERAINAAGGVPVAVRTPEQIGAVDGLILPGGESTTIGKLLVRYGLDTAIRVAHANHIPLYGTCAGMILLAERITQGSMRGGQPTLGLMGISVARNAFGRQVDSFEADIHAPQIVGEGDLPLRGVFIRAPYVEEVRPDVQVLARYEDKIVLVRQQTLLASAFHPELTHDNRVHQYFLQMVAARRNKDADSGEH